MPKATSVSTTEDTSWLSGFWKTMPAVFRICQIFSGSFVFIPSIQASPESGERIPFRIFDSVDLPEPLCPMMPTNSPRATVKLTSLSACLGWSLSSTG